MLFTTAGKQIRRVSDAAEFKRAVRLLGSRRAQAIRGSLNRLIDEMPPDKKIKARIFSSARLASELEPWPYPLAGLYDIALEIEGKEATGRQVHDQAGLMFGLFVWECIMSRKERWVLSDPSSTSSEPTRQISEQVYIEQRRD